MQDVNATAFPISLEEDCVSCLLIVNRTRILCDCGAQTVDDFKKYDSILEGQVDAVVISHVDLAHCGALPYLVHKGLACPLYMSIPTKQLAELAVGEYLIDTAEWKERGQRLPYTMEDVHTAFTVAPVGLAVALHHGERVSVGPVTLCPWPAGRTVGGSIWEFTVRSEKIVYAMGVNHADGPILPRTALGKTLVAPTALITDGSQGLQLDEVEGLGQLLDAIKPVIERKGSVLVPLELLARGVDLLAGLETRWSSDVPLIVAGRTGKAFMSFARSYIEWTKPEVAEAFLLKDKHPFDFPKITICLTLEEVHAITGPKVVFVNAATLDHGLARTLFVDFAQDAANLIVLPPKPRPGSLGYILQHVDLPTLLTVEIPERKPLSEEDLRVWQQSRDAAKRKARQQARRQEELEQLHAEELADLQGTTQAFAAGEGKEEGEGDLVVEEQLDNTVEEKGLEEDSFPEPAVSHLSSVGGSPPGIPVLETKELLAPSIDESKASSALGRTRFPMFTQQSQEVRMTDYGEEVDESMFVVTSAVEDRIQALNVKPDPRILNKTGDQSTGIPGVSSEDLAQSAGGSFFSSTVQQLRPLDVDLATPTELNKVTRKILVTAAIKVIDLRALAGGMSMASLIETARPDRLVFARGSKSACAAVVSHLGRGLCKYIARPDVGVPCDISSGRLSLRALIDPESEAALKYESVGSYKVARLTATLHAEDGRPVLRAANEPSTTRSAALLSWSVIRLPHLKRKIEKATKLKCVHSRDTITTSGAQVVSRPKNKGFDLIAASPDEFYAIRRVLYKSYTVV